MFFNISFILFKLKPAALCLIFIVLHAANAQEMVRLKLESDQIEEILDSQSLPPYFSEEMIQGLAEIPTVYNRKLQLIAYNSETYAISSCYFDVYKWEEDTWQNHYLFGNRGYTCGAWPFFYQNQLHFLGGYGFWNNHTDLLSFDEIEGSWSLETPSNQPSSYNTELIGIGKESAFLFLGIHHNPRLNINNVYEDEGFYLDLKSMNWSRLSFEGLISHTPGKAKFLIQRGIGIDTENFFVFNAFASSNNEMGLVLFDKRSMEFRFFKRDSPFDFFNYAAWIAIKGDQIQFVDNFNSIQELDIDGFFQHAEYVGKAKIESLSPALSFKWKERTLLFLGLLVSLLLILYLFVKFFPRLSRPFIGLFLKTSDVQEESSSRNETDDEIAKIFHELHSLKGKVLNTEELDKLFKIDTIKSLDYRKVRRSRLLLALNSMAEKKYGKSIIKRKRNLQDKRFLEYEIS
ncbi:hypothetical protein [Algoriphagus formosus]|uniref:hypothetical protein n=1 Tax=Algoriphagus formosus TaxID=2007308 RepID=UPI000C28379D|nr:hypothetical protein [Algoriphagus formosus]